MDANLNSFYQGSLYTPEGFKGFPPNSTSSENVYICLQIKDPQSYVQCQSQAMAVKSLPKVGASELSLVTALIIAPLIYIVVKNWKYTFLRICPRCKTRSWYKEVGVCLKCEEYDRWNK